MMTELIQYFQIRMDGFKPPTLNYVVREYMDFVLRRCSGNKSQAAKILGINRRTMYRQDTVKALRTKPLESKPGRTNRTKVTRRLGSLD